MKKTITLNIEELAPLASGLARHNKKIIFADYTIPGEKILATITEEHKDYSRAKAIEILEPSPYRTKPQCPHYTICKGCNMQHITYPQQTEYKKKWLKKLLEDKGLKEIPDIQSITSSPYHYRNRFQIHIEDKKAGYRNKEGRHIAITQCPILQRPADKVFSEDFSHITDKKRLSLFCRSNKIYGLSNTEEFIVSLNNKRYYGRTDLFFQSNIEVLEKLLAWLGEKTRDIAAGSVWDLYAGSGLFSSLFAERAKDLKLVEAVSDSLALAEKQLGSSAGYYAMPVEDFFSYPAAAKKPDVIIADPPRSGMSKTARKELAATASPVMIYISCNPASFARDAAFLLDKGRYRLKELVMCDFYPQTHHAEFAALMLRE